MYKISLLLLHLPHFLLMKYSYMCIVNAVVNSLLKEKEENRLTHTLFSFTRKHTKLCLAIWKSG